MTELTRYEETLLLEAVASGDENAFSRLYLCYYGRIHSYVQKLVKLPTLAEDIVQEIFIKVWEARTRLTSVKHFRAFLFAIARNHSLNSLESIARSRQRLTALIHHLQNHRVDDEAPEHDYRHFIEKALGTLPPRSREIFRLCREQSMTYDQVAADLGISRNAVKKHMVAVIRRLKEAKKELDLS